MLYVFDCDGVLVDSEIIASEVDAEHLTRLGYPITPEEVTIRFAGLTARELGAIVEVEIGHPLPSGFFEEQNKEVDRRLSARLSRAYPLPGRQQPEHRAAGGHAAGDRRWKRLHATSRGRSTGGHLRHGVHRELGSATPGTTGRASSSRQTRANAGVSHL